MRKWVKAHTSENAPDKVWGSDIFNKILEEKALNMGFSAKTHAAPANLSINLPKRISSSTETIETNNTQSWHFSSTWDWGLKDGPRLRRDGIKDDHRALLQSK